jgi:hypothetical protein
MRLLLLPLGAFIAATALDAVAQRPMNPPHPAVMAAMEYVKDKCTKDTPCKYKVEPWGERTFVTIEFTRKETPASEPLPYPGGRTKLVIDKQGKLLERIDAE